MKWVFGERSRYSSDVNDEIMTTISRTNLVLRLVESVDVRVVDTDLKLAKEAEDNLLVVFVVVPVEVSLLVTLVMASEVVTVVLAVVELNDNVVVLGAIDDVERKGVAVVVGARTEVCSSVVMLVVDSGGDGVLRRPQHIAWSTPSITEPALNPIRVTIQGLFAHRCLAAVGSAT